MSRQVPSISKGVDWLMIWLYAAIVIVGLVCIFSVEYRSGDDVLQSFLGSKKITANSFIFFLPVLYWPFLFYLLIVSFLQQWLTFLI